MSLTEAFPGDDCGYNLWKGSHELPSSAGSSLAKRHHEFRDPIHTFIRVETAERAIIDSEPFQRLRHIHQLSLSHLIYPGATHERFEHCLGVMELAGMVYDVVTNRSTLHSQVRDLDFVHDKQSEHWQPYRTTVRMAAIN